MINSNFAFIFINFMRIVFRTTEMDTQTILNSAVHTEEQAALLYVAIEPSQVLPLVLFKALERKIGSRESVQILQLPQNLVQTVTLHGRLIQGTTFSTTNSKNQMFFCPKEDYEENCLIPQEFGKYDQLQCAKEPNPVVQKDAQESSCGPDNTGILYNIIYQICPSDEYVTRARPVYEICYNTTLRKTLYTTHIILNPLLLKTKSLYREHVVPYPFTENDELKPLNFEATNLASNNNLYSLIHPDKSDYSAQQLVPDTDLAFALWRKPTYQSFNLDWQHNSLIPLWNFINNCVKLKAIQMISQKIAIHVRTLVYDIIPAPEDAVIMSNIWVKIVTTIPSNSAQKIRGIVILMNNFIAKTTDDDSTKISNSTEKFIETFCANDFCVGSLVREFKKIGGTVRCCSLTSELAEKFGVRDFDADLPALFIFGLISDLPNVY